MADLQHATDILRLTMEAVMKTDPTGRSVLLNAIEVALAASGPKPTEIETVTDNVEDFDEDCDEESDAESDGKVEEVSTFTDPVARSPRVPRADLSTRIKEITAKVSPSKDRAVVKPLQHTPRSPFPITSTKRARSREQATRATPTKKIKKERKA